MATTPLTGIVSPSIRAKVYGGYAVVGVVIGAIQVGVASTNNGQPEWLTVGLAVYAYLGIALGFTAASNTNNPPLTTDRAEARVEAAEEAADPDKDDGLF